MLGKKRFSAALHESAREISPSPLTCQSILSAAMPEAVKEGRVSYAAAREQAYTLSREASRCQRGRVAALSLVMVAAALLIFVMPAGQELSGIPDETVPLDAAPGSEAAQMTLQCQTAEGGYVHVRAAEAEAVDWQALYALDQDGQYIAPYAIYPELELAIFAPPAGDIVIYAPLMSGALASCTYIRD